MLKKIGALLIVCCFAIAAMPYGAAAAQTAGRQILVKKNVVGLQKKLLRGAATDTTPLHALTIEYLDALMAAGFKKNPADLELATQRYIADMQEQAQATALEPACIAPLLINITQIGGYMLAEVTSLDTPLCKTINLSASVAGIMYAKYDYDICVLENSANPDNATLDNLLKLEYGLEVFDFSMSALNLFLCTTSATAQDYINLLLNFIRLFE